MPRTTKTDLDAYGEQTLATIHRSVLAGDWAYQPVEGIDHGLPAFGYTIGRWAARQQPEFLVMGLRPEISRPILRAIAALDPASILDGEIPTHIVSNTALRLRAIALPTRSSPFFPASLYAYYARYPVDGPVPMLQVVWPDRFGVFPEGLGAGAASDAQRLLPPPPLAS